MASRLQDVILRGLSANKPLAADVAPGTLYYSADTLVTERSNGTAWESYNDAGGGTGGGTNNSGNFLVSGGAITWLQNYDFRVSAAVYFIQNVQYTSTEQTITLDSANPTNPRIDLIGVNNSGIVFKVTGTAGVNPSEPDIDPGTQLKLGIVLVQAATTEPVINTEVLYADNVGSPTEWNWTTSGSGFNVNSTTNPKAPSTKDIEGTAVTAGAYAQGQIGTGTIIPYEFNNLIIYIRSKSTWSSGRGLTVTLRSTGVQIGNPVTINRTGTFGFDSSIITDYQLVAIPVTTFAIPSGSTVNQIRIAAFGAGHGFHLDAIEFQGGNISQTVAGITQDQGDARYLQRANNLSDLTDPAAARVNLGITARIGSIELIIDGGASVITTGFKGYLEVPFACTIQAVTLLADAVGSIVVDIWKDTYLAYPPVAGDSITASAKPTISSAQKSQNSVLTGWTTAVTAGDILGFNVDSVATIKKITLSLKVQVA